MSEIGTFSSRGIDRHASLRLPQEVNNLRHQPLKVDKNVDKRDNASTSLSTQSKWEKEALLFSE